MKMKRLETVAIRNELVKVRYLKKIRVPALRAGEVGDVREIPRHTAYQMALKGKVEIVQDGKSNKKGRK